MTEDEITFDQQGCARCDGDGHERITYKKLERAISLPGATHDATHWATCPATGEPILLVVMDVTP